MKILGPLSSASHIFINSVVITFAVYTHKQT